MAFKGTARIGSLEWRREAPLLDALDEAFYSLRAASAAGAEHAAQVAAQDMARLQACYFVASHDSADRFLW